MSYQRTSRDVALLIEANPDIRVEEIVEFRRVMKLKKHAIYIHLRNNPELEYLRSPMLDELQVDNLEDLKVFKPRSFVIRVLSRGLSQGQTNFGLINSNVDRTHGIGPRLFIIS